MCLVRQLIYATCIFGLVNFHWNFQDVEGKTTGTVIAVSKIGYKLHDRVIRPALVGVAK